LLDGEISGEETNSEKTLPTGNISNITTPKQSYEGLIDDIEKSLEGDTANFNDIDTYKYGKYDVLNDEGTYFNSDAGASAQAE